MNYYKVLSGLTAVTLGVSALAVPTAAATSTSGSATSDTSASTEEKLYLPQTVDTSDQVYDEWNTQGFVDYKYFENITPNADMKVTFKYDFEGGYKILRPIDVADGWSSMKKYITGIDLKEDLTSDEFKDREENGGDPVIDSDGWIHIYDKHGELSFTISAEGVAKLIKDAEDNNYGGLALQSSGFTVSEVTVEETHSLPQTIDTSSEKYSKWGSQGSVDYTYFNSITPNTDMTVSVKYNIIGDDTYHLLKPMNLDGWGSIKQYISGIELKDSLTEEEIADREENGGAPILQDDGFFIIYGKGEGELTFTISAEGVKILHYSALSFQSYDVTVSEVTLAEKVSCPDCECTKQDCENWSKTLAKCTCGCADDNFTAFLIFTDSNWAWGNWKSATYEDDPGKGKDATITSGDHSYTVSISADKLGETKAADGITCFMVDIPGLADVIGANSSEIKTASGAEKMQLAKDSGLDIHNVVVSVDGEDIYIDDDDLFYGDFESNGNIRLEIYNVYGESGDFRTENYNAPSEIAALAENLVATDSISVSFDLDCKLTSTDCICSPCHTTHTYDSIEVTAEPTCSADGVITYTCTVCGKTKTGAIDATDHTAVIDPAVEATCTAPGKTEGSHCSVCGEVITEQKNVTAKGHTAVADSAVAATCTKDGKTSGSHCSVCGKVITAQTVIKATGHSYDTGKITKAATCTADGVKTYTCVNCESTKTETIKATGKHNYVATKTVKPTVKAQGYTLNKCSVCGKTTKTNYTAKLIAMSKTKVSGVKSTYAYTGKGIAPTVTVKYGSTKLVKGTDYTVSYKNNTKTGKATVTITGKGKYSGTVTKTFTIVPKKTTVSSVKSSKTKTVTVKWKKDSQATGYELLYSTSNKFSSAKKITVAKNSTVSKTLTKLSKGKTYYVKVRAFKTVSGKKYYGAYSAVKKVKCK